MKNKSNIVFAPFSFQPIYSDFQKWIYKNVQKGDSLIILKELDLTGVKIPTDENPPNRRISDAVAFWKFFNQAKEEFAKTGKIKGYEVLNLRSLDRIWISHYVIRILQQKNDI